jgi:hypothetical protein
MPTPADLAPASGVRTVAPSDTSQSPSVSSRRDSQAPTMNTSITSRGVNSATGSRPPSRIGSVGSLTTFENTGTDGGRIANAPSKGRRRAPRFSRRPATAEPRESQLSYYSSADRENISLAKEQFVLDLCFIDAFPDKTFAMRSAREALAAAALVTKHSK